MTLAHPLLEELESILELLEAGLGFHGGEVQLELELVAERLEILDQLGVRVVFRHAPLNAHTAPPTSHARLGPMDAWIRELTGAERVTRQEHLQTLWSGYGEILRVQLEGADVPSVIVKHVTPGSGRGRSHERKLRSYDVERAFYRTYAERCGDGCRVARCLAAERTKGGWRFLLEDLDAAGFAGRRSALSETEVHSCLAWLARFHATFMGQAPDQLWGQGTYWHLKTRPDELAAITDARLREAAPALDSRLRRARFRTFVHGDAKPANFCFTADGSAVAAVDFQYVGGGCGMKDVAYLLFGRRGWGGRGQGSARLLDFYFAELRGALDPALDGHALEAEWRALYPVARADFHRFLAGWSPSSGTVRDYRDALAVVESDG